MNTTEYSDIENEEEACWVIWLRETEAETPVVEVVISVDSLVQEVQA